MEIEEFISEIGYLSTPDFNERVKEIFIREIQDYRDASGDRDSDLLKICAMNLCYHGILDDIKLIWEAKMLSMDTGCMIDIQYLCGASLKVTKEYLNTLGDDWAKKALNFIADCEKYGDFEDFNPKLYIEENISYFKNE